MELAAVLDLIVLVVLAYMQTRQERTRRDELATIRLSQQDLEKRVTNVSTEIRNVSVMSSAACHRAERAQTDALAACRRADTALAQPPVIVVVNKDEIPS